MQTAFERMQNWSTKAIKLLDVEDKGEALEAAYEAGRYGFEMPTVLATHPDLVEAYQRGRKDVVIDAEAWDRFCALADAFPESCPAL